MVRQHSVSSKSVQKKTCSEGQCSSAAEKAREAAKGTNGYPQCQLLIVLVFPSARGSSQQNFSWSYRLGSVAVVGCMTRVSTEIQLNLCPCNSRQVETVKGSVHPTLEIHITIIYFYGKPAISTFVHL